jgi:hypothetical protein
MAEHPQARVVISSPPDRERLVAEIFFGDAQWAEVLCEDGELLEVEHYPKPDGRPWRVPLALAQEALATAANRLRER